MSTAMDAGSSWVWWGRFDVAAPTAGRWQVGPLTLWIQRLAGEWRLAYERSADHLDPSVSIELPAAPPDMMTMDTVMRFALAGGASELHVTPVLADRPVVTRPRKPFVILPGERTTLYISSPLWVRLEVGPDRRFLTDFPVFRPSDTWFGRSTREGELCYASRTFCYQRLEELPRRPHRVTSAVTLHNQSRAPMPFERMKLPVGQLSVYRGADGHLWTDDIMLNRLEGQDIAQPEPDDRVIKEARARAELLSSPREPAASGHRLVRVFGSLFS